MTMTALAADGDSGGISQQSTSEKCMSDSWSTSWSSSANCKSDGAVADGCESSFRAKQASRETQLRRSSRPAARAAAGGEETDGTWSIMERGVADECEGESSSDTVGDEGADDLCTTSCRSEQDDNGADAQNGCDELGAGAARAKARMLRATARRRRLSASQKRRLRADERGLGSASIAERTAARWAVGDGEDWAEEVGARREAGGRHLF